MRTVNFNHLMMIFSSLFITTVVNSQSLTSTSPTERLSIRRTIKEPVTEKVEAVSEVKEQLPVLEKEELTVEIVEEQVATERGEVIVEIVEEVSVVDKKEEISLEEKFPGFIPEQSIAINTTIAPSTKFDLSDWSLSVPADEDGNGRADQIKEKELNSGYANKYFYTATDGGMVFKCPIGGAKTSQNTSYTRSELREMLRAGDKKIKTKGPNQNNWVLQSSNSIYNAAGYDGQLSATLKVDYVTTTGDDKQVGRVIIGQIHAEHNEPLRLYYRKLPNNEKGSIYFAHEGRDNGKEDYYELVGSKSSKAKNPENGIALGEKFSYQVLVLGNSLGVKIIKEDKSIFEKRIDIRKSGYAAKDEYMYFKAGVYNQNKTGHPEDYVQATFYELSNKHKKYVEPSYDD